MALSLYRKYRPNVFSDVVGQEHVERTLVNAITEGSVAHAYLFCGPRGTGKTTTARLLAKALLCENASEGQPDGSCAQCLAIANGTHADVNELDAASRTGVDNVREEIISRVGFAPTQGRYKIYIIDEVHMLSDAAFNALLKTLEEPPEHVIFILCTTDPHMVPETIQSRCQRFDFRRLSVDEIVGYLKRICAGENFEYEQDALEFIAAKSAGGMRDATTSLEQVAVYTSGKITMQSTEQLFGQPGTEGLFEIGCLIAKRDTASCLGWLDQLVGTGVDLAQFAHGLSAHMRNLYVTALTGGKDGIVACTASQLQTYQEQAHAFGGEQRLARALTICSELTGELRHSGDARLSVEVALVRLCRADSELTLDALCERVEELENKLAGVSSVPTSTQKAQSPAPQQPAATAASAPQQPAATAASTSQTQTRQQPVAEAAASTSVAAEPFHAQATHEEQHAAAHDMSAAHDASPERSKTAASSSAAGMSPARMLAAVLTVIKREDVATGALLNSVDLVIDSNGYHLVFPENARFSMTIANKGDARALIERAFKEVVGNDAHIDLRLANAQPTAAASTQPADSVQDSANARFDDTEAFDDGSPVYDEPVYADSFADDISEPDSDTPLASKNTSTIDDETAADLANALSAFGKGVKVHEIKDGK